MIDLSDRVRRIISDTAAEATKRHHEYWENRKVTKAWWLGYSSVEEMESHLAWLETRFPEGAEL